MIYFSNICENKLEKVRIILKHWQGWMVSRLTLDVVWPFWSYFLSPKTLYTHKIRTLRIYKPTKAKLNVEELGFLKNPQKCAKSTCASASSWRRRKKNLNYVPCPWPLFFNNLDTNQSQVMNSKECYVSSIGNTDIYINF